MMLRHPLRNAYFALVGVLLFTLPIFAVVRFQPICDPVNCDGAPGYLPHASAVHAFWQGGLPPHDYWPLGVALLAVAAAIDVVMMVRLRRSARLHLDER